MNTQDDLLQQRLARLEAGEALESCLSGLPEAEADLIRKAADLRAIPKSTLTAERMAVQRQELLEFAKEHTAMDTRSSRQNSKSPWALPFALAGGVFILLACVTAVALLSGFFVLNNGVVSSKYRLNIPLLNQKAGNPEARVAEATVTAVPSTAEAGPAVAGALNALNAQLVETRGLVEVQGVNGAWSAATNGLILEARQSLRTGALSGAALVFYDGSRVSLGPNSEILLETVDAPRSGARVIRLNQKVGESDHQVVTSTDPGSVYEVITPDGTGAAKGTVFHVVVLETRMVRFDVDEGVVIVTKSDAVVQIVGGQSTYIIPSAPPSPPLYRINGRGKVEKSENSWHIGGVIFLVDGHTIMSGNPQVGDWVSYEALVLPDGSRLLILVSLLQRAPENRFSFTGKVEAIGDLQWTIAGRVIQTGAAPRIDPGIKVGSLVEVEGRIAENGSLVAERIHLLVEKPGLPFLFSGVVTKITPTSWTVSNITITVNISTTIMTGIGVGDLVEVRGWTLADGTWLAQGIKRSTGDVHEFSIMGPVLTLSPLNVAGVQLVTDEDTEFEAMPKVGDRVRVTGIVLADGRWLAQEVQLVEVPSQSFQFVGFVTSLSPWVVDQIPLTLSGSAEIVGNIAVGDLVWVQGVILPDGTWSVQKIQRLELNRGCLTETAVIIKWEADGFEVEDFHWGKFKKHHNLKISGDVKVATVVIFSGCMQSDGTFTIVQVTAIHQLDSLPDMRHEHEDEDDDEHEED